MNNQIVIDSMFHFEREFELRFLKSRGIAFQNLFSQIMEGAYPGDFQRIRAHGNTGDLKCDGYQASRRIVFQVYGPDSFQPLSKLLRKIQDDFDGAVDKWGTRMDRWIFVHNSESGLPAQAEQLLQDLQAGPNAPTIDKWGYPEL